MLLINFVLTVVFYSFVLKLWIVVFELENNKLIFRHIDIDFINGEFLELNDTDKRYQRLKEIFSVNETDFENDMLLYKRGEQCD